MNETNNRAARFFRHENVWIAYVYDQAGEVLRWRFHTSEMEANAWARRKADKIARRHPRDINQQPIQQMPWCVREFTSLIGSAEHLAELWSRLERFTR